MSPVPSTKLNDVLDTFNTLMNRIKPATDFELAKLNKDINALALIDEAAYLAMRGTYSALTGDEVKSREYHERAIQSSHGSPVSYYAYSVSLSYMEKRDEAIIIGEKAIAEGGPVLMAIHGVLFNAYYTDDKMRLEKWLPRYEKMAGEPHEVAAWLDEDAEDLKDIPDILEDIEKNGTVSFEKVKEELGL